MANSEQQSVVAEADGGAQASVEAGSAQGDDFDALLAEYNEGVNKQQQTSTPAAPAQKVEPAQGGDLTLEKRLEMLERQNLARQEQDLLMETSEAVNKAVSALKPAIADLPVKISDKVIRGYLAETAQEDPRFMTAFESRDRDPAKWDRVVAALGRKMRAEFGDATDTAATETRAAVSAAVRASATRAAEPETKNWATMSNKDFFAEAHKAAR